MKKIKALTFLLICELLLAVACTSGKKISYDSNPFLIEKSEFVSEVLVENELKQANKYMTFLTVHIRSLSGKHSFTSYPTHGSIAIVDQWGNENILTGIIPVPQEEDISTAEKFVLIFGPFSKSIRKVKLRMREQEVQL